MASVRLIREWLASREPRLVDATRRAAVAVVLHDASPDEILFIERARRWNDPWSGDMAFPGGRVDPCDADARAAAERETREELGLDLADAEALGRLDDLNAGIPLLAPFALSAFVYRLDARRQLSPNREVQSALWVPFPSLLAPERRVGRRVAGVRWPGIQVGDIDRHVVWGLTYRLLQCLLDGVGVRLPGWRPW